MEKRVLLAIFLCFLSLYVWQALVVKPVPKPPPASAPTAAGTTATAVAPSTPASPTPPTTAEALPPSSAAMVTGETEERTLHVETRDVVAEFTNRGARLKSWRLKHYLDQSRRPQELVVGLPAQPLPFTLHTADQAVDGSINRALYAVRGGENTAGAESPQAPVELRFEYQDTAGLHVTKNFRLEPSGYVITFQAVVARDNEPPLPYSVLWGPAVGDIGEISRYTKAAGALWYSGEQGFGGSPVVRRAAPKDFATQPTYKNDFRYVGVDDNYFLTASLNPGPTEVAYQAIPIPPLPGSKDPERNLVAYAITPRSIEAPQTFFAGPKDFDVLGAISPDLTYAIDFGWFRLIVVPLLKSLKWINNYVGNYGWSIILLTVIINAIMFPLRHKSNVSMRKMQEIQPEVKTIQDRYAKLKATDPAKQKMNTELMALYRERGVNPAGGCVPMLLTMPVLIALYSLLSTAIELRGAPFFGWIHDLSAHDPLYITPVIMGATMVWQQRLAPAGADPVQQKMMMFMPIMFTVMFLWAPAGVAVYWLVGNLLGIGQQYLTNYLIGPPKPHNVRPAAERRIKKVSGGKP